MDKGLRIILVLVCLAANLAGQRVWAAKDQLRHHRRSEVISSVAQDDLVWGPRAPEAREVMRQPETRFSRFLGGVREMAAVSLKVCDREKQRLLLAKDRNRLVRRLLRLALPRSRPEDPSDVSSVA